MPIKERNEGTPVQSFIRPDLKTLNYAVTEFFTRDMREKNSASMAMVLTQLEQADMFQFCDRLLQEIPKYDNLELIKLGKELELLFYGKYDTPDITEEYPIPLYYLQADASVEGGMVRIKGIYDPVIDTVNDQLEWATWQMMKLQSKKQITNVCGKIVNLIDTINNFNEDLRDLIDKVVNQANITLKQLIKIVEVDEFIEIGYEDNDENRYFENQLHNNFTVKFDTKKTENQKYKRFTSDYFYNLQMLFSQCFNVSHTEDQFYPVTQIIGYLKNNKLVKRHNGKIFTVYTLPKLNRVFDSLINLIVGVKALYNLKHIPNLTTDERLGIEIGLTNSRTAYYEGFSLLQRIVGYILTSTPVLSNKQFGFQEGSF